MDYVIAGVSGNTGSVAAAALLDAGAKVRVVVRDAAKGAPWKARGAEVAVADLISHSDKDEKLVMLGDALMHPAELLDPGGSYSYVAGSRSPGVEWLRRLSAHFRRSAWLNPEPDRYWSGTTVEVIASVLPMWQMTLEGLAGAVRYLVRGGERPAVPNPSSWAKMGL